MDNTKFIKCFFGCCLKHLIFKGALNSLFVTNLINDVVNGVHTLLLDVSMNASDSNEKEEEV